MFGLATTGGLISTTGIGGLTLGGGLGWLMGKHGLSCDNLLSVDVVTAEGESLTANATENADLFWALRGGGGNFGVVTSFEYQLHAVGEVVGGLVAHPVANAAEVLRFYRDYTASAPDELTVFAGLHLSPRRHPRGARSASATPDWRQKPTPSWGRRRSSGRRSRITSARCHTGSSRACLTHRRRRAGTTTGSPTT